MLRVFKWVLLLCWTAAFAAQAQPGVVAFADRPEVENRLLEERLELLLP